MKKKNLEGMPKDKPENKKKLVNEPPEIYMNPMDMMKLSLKEAQVGQLREQVEKLKYQESLMLLEQKALLASLRAKRREAENQCKAYTDDYNKLLAEVQGKLGVNLKEYGVNDEGKLTLLPQQGILDNG